MDAPNPAFELVALDPYGRALVVLLADEPAAEAAGHLPEPRTA